MASIHGNGIAINIVINTTICRAVIEIYAQCFPSDLEGTSPAAS